MAKKVPNNMDVEQILDILYERERAASLKAHEAEAAGNKDAMVSHLQISVALQDAAREIFLINNDNDDPEFLTWSEWCQTLYPIY